MDRKELEEKICELLEIDSINLMIKKQINKFRIQKEYGYTYKDIARALYYFVEVQKNVPDKSRGIGIVPFVIDDARKYFERELRKLAAQKAIGKQIKENAKIERKTIIAKAVRKRRKDLLIDMDED